MTAEKRMEICLQCPIYKSDFLYGAVCDKNKFIDPVTNEVSRFPKKGYVKGCGCKLKMKVKNPNAHCIAGKW